MNLNNLKIFYFSRFGHFGLSVAKSRSSFETVFPTITNHFCQGLEWSKQVISVIISSTQCKYFHWIWNHFLMIFFMYSLSIKYWTLQKQILRWYRRIVLLSNFFSHMSWKCLGKEIWLWFRYKNKII